MGWHLEKPHSYPAFPIRRIKVKLEKPRKQILQTTHGMRLRRQVPVRQTVIWCLSYIEWNWTFQMLKRGAWENMEQSLPRNMCVLTEISLYFHRKLLLAYISLEWVSTLKPFQSVSICKMTSSRMTCFGSLGSTDPAPINCPPSNSQRWDGGDHGWEPSCHSYALLR